MNQEICKKIEEQINKICESGINTSNLELLYKLEDIHKDIANEKYWKEKIEIMRNDYNNYNRSYNRSYYNDYGRRGYDTKYRGNEYLDNMYNGYNDYNEYSEYGHNEDGMRALDFMLQSMEDFSDMLMKNAKSSEEKQRIKETMRNMAQR